MCVLQYSNLSSVPCLYIGVVMVQLFLLGNPFAGSFNKSKLLAWLSHLGLSCSVVKYELFRLQESPNSR